MPKFDAQLDVSIIQRSVLGAVPALGLRAGAHVLDAPCGAGALAAALASSGLTVSGVDLDVSGSAAGVDVRAADLDRPLPFPDGIFDAVFSIEGIEHLENAFGFLREAHRVLKAGGILVL